jgi:hypothetical protein
VAGTEVAVRRTPALIAATAALALLAPEAGAGASPDRVRAEPRDPYGTVWNIVPPGSRGNIGLLDVLEVIGGLGTTAVDGENAPDNYADQLEMYDALTTQQPGDISRADLDDLYKRAGFTPEVVVSTERPRDGVTIRRDQFGVPYIRGATYADTMYGAGYAAVQDRMFLMDVLRHTGAARMAEFVGATPANVAMDQEQLRTAFYTPEEAEAQVLAVVERYGAEGRRLLGGVDAYLEGINDAQDALCPGGLPTGVECPVEYAALQKFPTDWTRADLVYVASLVVTELFAETEANVFKAPCVKGIRLEGGSELTRKQIDALVDQAKLWGAKGLAWMRVVAGEQGTPALEGGVAKFLSDAETVATTAALEAAPGDMVFLIADERAVARHVLGLLRLELGKPPMGEGDLVDTFQASSSLDAKTLCGKTTIPGSTGQNLPLHTSGVSNPNSRGHI